MPNIAIKLHAERLSNPDLDIRYALPDLLKARSGGVISDDGYDYVGDTNDLVLFLQVSNVEQAIACILEVITNVPVLDNDLRDGAVVAIKRDGKFDVIYPINSQEEFRV